LCSIFFIWGSPVETQCLAALEACLCDVPIIMKNVGIFKDFLENEKEQIGIIGDDFENAIKQIKGKKVHPRQVILSRKLSISDTVKAWEKIIRDNMQRAMLYKYNKNIIERRETLYFKEKILQKKELKREMFFLYKKRLKQKVPKIYFLMKSIYSCIKRG